MTGKSPMLDGNEMSTEQNRRRQEFWTRRFGLILSGRGDPVAAVQALRYDFATVDETDCGSVPGLRVFEGGLPRQAPAEAWAVCVALGSGRRFNPTDAYRTSRQVVHLLVETVARGGRLLLWAGLKPDGRLPDEALRCLREVGEWLAVNAAALEGEGEVLAPCGEGIWYVRRQTSTFAIICPPAGAGRPPATIQLTQCLPVDGREIRLLGLDRPLRWQRRAEAIHVDVPTSGLPCDFAWTLAWTSAPMD